MLRGSLAAGPHGAPLRQGGGSCIPATRPRSSGTFKCRLLDPNRTDEFDIPHRRTKVCPASFFAHFSWLPLPAREFAGPQLVPTTSGQLFEISPATRSCSRPAAPRAPGPGACAYIRLLRALLIRGRRDNLPSLIGVERCNASAALSHVLLEDLPGMVDHEGHHAGISIIGRKGDECETPDHLAADDVIEGTAGSVRPLLGENLVIVPVERRATPAGRVALLGCLSKKLP